MNYCRHCVTSVQARHLLPSLAGSSAPLQFAMRGNVLQFPVIQMANCTQPPALNDKWQQQKKHISSNAQLTSRLHTDIPAESVVKSSAGCMKTVTGEAFYSHSAAVRSYLCLRSFPFFFSCSKADA